jgi:prepilin-type processing-associated H-X9-DG protein
MKKRKGITLIECLVIIAVIALILLIILPTINIADRYPRRVICGTNLKGLGTAMTVYANDYDDNYPQLRGIGPWSKELGFKYDLTTPDFSPAGPQGNVGRTITASWYMLVREADVAPKSFVCPQSDQEEFDGKNPQNRDIVELWDFGSEPYKHVSYAMHNPYGKFPANAKRPKDFAVAADMSPWFKDGNALPTGKKDQPPQIIKLTDESTWKFGLSTNHQNQNKLAEGHNVLYADGHSSWENKPNVGFNKDNIFTFQSTDKDPTEQDIQGGINPTGRSPENDAKSEKDSFLAI